MNEAPQVLQSLIDLGRSLEPVAVAVCHPCTDVSLAGAAEAGRAQLIDPVPVGPPAKMQAVADRIGVDISRYRLVATAHSHESAARAVALCRSAECEAPMIKTAGIVLGARVPVILTSRADSAETRLASSAVAVKLAHARRQGTADAIRA